MKATLLSHASLLSIASASVFALPSVLHVRRETNAQVAPNILSPSAFAATSFDFVIVGGGTSGLVLARRLTESSQVTVGVIEAGDYRPNDPLILTPNGADLVMNTTDVTTIGNPGYDWMFRSVPQDGLGGRTISYPRGKLIGGSSALNAMIYQRASAGEYDNWATIFGNGQDWSFNSLVKYFKKAENWHAPTVRLPGQVKDPALASEHGTQGPVAITYNNVLAPTDGPITAAAEKLGIKFNSNPDGGNVYSIALPARSVGPDGRRSYAENSYYTPIAGRPNLKVVTGALVNKIQWRETTSGSVPVASGVEYTVDGSTYTAKVNKEVILAAGSLKTPQVLELSGVGNRTLLNSLGIPVIVNLPTVGENLQDHPVSTSDFTVKQGVFTFDQLGTNASYTQEQLSLYENNGTGALSYTPAVAGALSLQTAVDPSTLNAMLKTLQSEISSKPINTLTRTQYNALISMAKSGAGWFETTVIPNGGVASTPQPNTGYISSVSIQLHEFSRSHVHINSTDPSAAPLIDPKFFSFQWDVDVLAYSLQWIRKWTNTTPAGALIEANTTPPNSVNTSAQFREYVKNVTSTTNHPIGTTAMASHDLGGVVNNKLKVYGLANVRIVDAGIIPMTIGVALQGTVYAVAEKAADLIKEDWNSIF
ncbi:alcohol oxidase [Amylostereum chailletii]|nr:alcohol oxidase [Amylostereum chailletii]